LALLLAFLVALGWNVLRQVFHYSLEVPALGELFAGQFEQQASAAAEGMPLSVSWTSLGGFLFRRDFLPVQTL
jgi:hypothetical protein